MPLTRDDLAAACSRNDLVVDAGGSVPALLMNLGVEPQGCVYVAEQRALRVALLHSGVMPTRFSTATARSLHKTQRDLIPVYAGVWIDGLVAGVRAYYEALNV